MVVPTTSSEYDRLQKWIRENNALKDPATRKLITQQPEETTTTIIEKIILDSESDDHVEVVNFEGEHEDDDYDNFGEEIITENEEGISHIYNIRKKYVLHCPPNYPFFSKFYGKVGVISWFLFHLI